MHSVFIDKHMWKTRSLLGEVYSIFWSGKKGNPTGGGEAEFGRASSR